MSDILRLENINYSYIDGGYERQILKDLSYSFEAGRFYTVLGPSGSGKTTLLSIIAGLDTPNSGEIYFDGKNIKEIGLHKYRRNSISIVFQQYNLISYLTALENVMLAMSETDNKLPKDRKNVAYNLLARFGIVKSKADRMVNQLSGGEQQRVAIARSLASNVNLIFADEPTGNLDTATEKEIIAIFKELSHEFSKTIIVVTHSDTVSAMSDQRVLLRDGKLTDLT
jgi:putative ABC transport system ATP-binding protein